MPSNLKLRVFLDTNVIFSGLYSSEGSAGVILEHFIAGRLVVVISQQVLEEIISTIKEKLPGSLPALRKLLLSVALEIVKNPVPDEVARWSKAITHTEDATILSAAIAAQPDYFVTGDKHFLGNPEILEESGLHIVTPSQFLERLGDK